MGELKQVVESRSYRSHKQGVDFHVPNEEFVGKRGGRKIPLEIVWKQCGYGLGAMVFRICSCTVLYPRVRYHNGKGKPRTMYVEEWVRLTGKGYHRKLNEEAQAAFDEALVACNKEKSFYGGRVAEIVTSILDNGGTLTVSNR